MAFSLHVHGQGGRMKVATSSAQRRPTSSPKRTCHRANKGGIDGELCPVPNRQAVENDINVPCIVDRRVNVHGGERNVEARWRVRGVGRARRMWSRLGGLPTHQVRRGRGSCASREEDV